MTAASRPDWFGDHAAARQHRSPSAPVVGAVAAGLAFFLTLTVAAGLVAWDGVPTGSLTRGGEALGAAGPDGTPAAAPVDQLDRSSRTARVGPVSLVLPADPYVVHPDPMALDGVLNPFFWAAATVHPRYDGRHDWSSAVLLGRLTGAAATGDLEADARLALQRLSGSFFDGFATDVSDVAFADQAVDGHPGMLLTATVHYLAPGLPSRSDTVSVLLVRLEDGTVAMAATSVPDDTDPAVARQAADALRTLSIQ